VEAGETCAGTDGQSAGPDQAPAGEESSAQSSSPTLNVLVKAVGPVVDQDNDGLQVALPARAVKEGNKGASGRRRVLVACGRTVRPIAGGCR
jgi:hypothetical protein